MKKLLPILIIAILVVGVGTFYGGMKYSENTRRNFIRQNLGGQQFGAGQIGNQTRTGFASGEIIAKDEKSITIKLRDGGSKIIFFSDSTEIVKSVNGTSTDLEIGKTIIVNGNTNQDGSVTAKSIQLRSEVIPVAPNQP